MRDHDTVGRLGGDEFVVLVDTAGDETTLDILADRLTEVLREPVALDGGAQDSSAVTASIGVAFGQYNSPDDAAARRGPRALRREGSRQGPLRAVRCEHVRRRLKGAWSWRPTSPSPLQQDQFYLLYQPIFDLPSQGVVGVEALIRWQHPVRGMVPPDSFIPLAEETGMIVADRPLGARGGLPPGGCLGGGRSRARHRCQRLRAPARPHEAFAEDVRAALAEVGHQALAA